MCTKRNVTLIIRSCMSLHYIIRTVHQTLCSVIIQFTHPNVYVDYNICNTLATSTSHLVHTSRHRHQCSQIGLGPHAVARHHKSKWTYCVFRCGRNARLRRSCLVLCTVHSWACVVVIREHNIECVRVINTVLYCDDLGCLTHHTASEA